MKARASPIPTCPNSPWLGANSLPPTPQLCCQQSRLVVTFGCQTSYRTESFVKMRPRLTRLRSCVDQKQRQAPTPCRSQVDQVRYILSTSSLGLLRNRCRRATRPLPPHITLRGQPPRTCQLGYTTLGPIPEQTIRKCLAEQALQVGTARLHLNGIAERHHLTQLPADLFDRMVMVPPRQRVEYRTVGL